MKLDLPQVNAHVPLDVIQGVVILGAAGPHAREDGASLCVFANE